MRIYFERSKCNLARKQKQRKLNYVRQCAFQPIFLFPIILFTLYFSVFLSVGIAQLPYLRPIMLDAFIARNMRLHCLHGFLMDETVEQHVKQAKISVNARREVKPFETHINYYYKTKLSLIKHKIAFNAERIGGWCFSSKSATKGRATPPFCDN